MSTVRTSWHPDAVPALPGGQVRPARGFKLEGLLSQRWRDGKEDIEGFWYEKNIALSHEDYGSVRIGAMTTRAWSVADYPYGTNLNVADAWASSGAGYGLLTKALRVTTRALDVYDGDLVLEATYDNGNTGWEKNKPRFWEFYAQYHSGDLVVDAMYQDTRNGTPSCLGPWPVHRATPFPATTASSAVRPEHCHDDGALSDRLELRGFGRRASQPLERRLCGCRTPGAASTDWPKGYLEQPFNVDWANDFDGGVYPGYEARRPISCWASGTESRNGSRHPVGTIWARPARTTRASAARAIRPCSTPSARIRLRPWLQI